MPNTNTQKCPACGGTLNVPVQGGKIKCSFCGTVMVMEAHEKQKGDEIVCPECGAINPKDAQHCGRCGIKLEFNCPKCGSLNTYGSVYCVKCGVDVNGEIQRQQQEIQNQEEQERRKQEVIRQRAENEKRSRKITTLVMTGIGILIVLCVAIAAGIGIYTTQLSPSARGTQTAVAFGETATTIYNTLYEDDFSDTNSGWGYYESENGSANYENGGYQINVISPNWLVWTTLPNKFQSDVRIEVDATKTNGSDNNIFGVICRYQEGDSYYFLGLSSDGYAAIAKVIDGNGDLMFISSEDGNMVKVSAINQGFSTNHIRAECVGSSLSLYINGTLSASATDTEFTDGGVGMKVGTGSDGETDILFKHFFVFRP
jgi:ribosomal protein L40E